MDSKSSRAYLSFLKANYFGWLIFFVLFNLYCIVWRQYALQTHYDFVGSLVWFSKEWGAWLVISPLLFLWLESAANKVGTATRIVFAGLALVTCALITRAYLNSGEYPDGWEPTVVIMSPKYVCAYLCLLAIWHFTKAQIARESTASQHLDDRADQPNTEIEVEHQGITVSIKTDQIFHLKTAGNYVEIICAEKSYLKRITLRDMMSKLAVDQSEANQFVQVHRSHAINLSKLVKLSNTDNGGGKAVLSNQRTVPVSKNYKPNLKSISISA